MGIFGVSHIVKEVNDLDQEYNLYKKKKYKKIFSINQKVFPEKKKILNNKPEYVKLYYLKKEKKGIGIELIKHDKQSNYFSSSVSYIERTNEIIILTPSYHKDLIFINKILNLKKIKTINKKFIKLYQNNNQKITSFNCGSRIFDNWSVKIHLLEIKKKKKNFFLNNIGFNCFCFLVNNFFVEKLVLHKIKIIGPFKEKKIINDVEQNFHFGFFTLPSGIIIEFLLK
jgi:hypothetical protein